MVLPRVRSQKFAYTIPGSKSPLPLERLSRNVILINMKAMYFATSVGRLTGEGGRVIWNTSHWTFIRSTPGHE